MPPYAEPSRLWALGCRRLADRSPLVGWGGPLLVALLAGVLRFWHLGRPQAVIFDETYYAKDAWALIHRGYEGTGPRTSTDPQPADPRRPPHGHPDRRPGATSCTRRSASGSSGSASGCSGSTPFGWRFMIGAARHAVGADAVPDRPAAVPLDVPRLPGGRADGGGRPALRDEPHRAARPRADVLRAGRLRLPGHRPGQGAASGSRPRCRSTRTVRRPDAHIAETPGSGWRPWRLAAGVCWAWPRDEVERPVLPRGLRPDDGPVGRRRAPDGGAPPALRSARPEPRRWRRPSCRRSPVALARLPRLLDRLDPRRRPTATSAHWAHDGRRRHLDLAARTRCAACGTTSTRSTSSTSA